MKFGTYFAYWEQEWDVDFFPYISKVAELGFDILEVSGGGLAELSDDELAALREEAKRCGIMMTACIGLPKEYDVSSEEEETRQKGLAYMKKIMDKMAIAGIYQIGGIIYAYWPVDYSLPVRKDAVRKISIQSVRELADYGKEKNIMLTLETVNRFEQFLFNDAAEATEFVKEVDRDNVKVMLDSFHMNIEEDNFYDPIVNTGAYLGHYHIGEANRKVPGKGHIPWGEIGRALREIGYDGTVVMEPFVRTGGGVGADIKVWRDLSGKADNAKLDEDIRESLAYLKSQFIS
ncbi:MAG: sugar phosphate isomerase/epimerase family protein [Blautia sp.]|jgi:D-psicose/D-tagatose/L-ribulose 3-epimerase